MLDTDHLSDEDLVALASNGDEKALTLLFDRHRDRLRRLIALRMDSRVQARVDASDVLQEAYLDLIHQLPNFVKGSPLPFFLWLRRITGQRLAKLHRTHLGAEKRSVSRELSVDAKPMPALSSFCLANELAGQFTSAGERAVREESKVKLQAVLNELDEKDREILALRHFEQLDNREIATLLGVSESAATRRYYRALSRLRSELRTIPGLLD
ncbi:MAG: sigma-70 family RNA polymerase sigma factor [Planctomycetota bacterium]